MVPPTRALFARFGLVWLALSLIGGVSLLVVGGPVTRFSDELAALPFLDLWARWDAQWYASIAREGYSFTPGAQSSVAFFPLYPLTIRAVMTLTGLGPLASGIAVTTVCGAAAFVVFHAWAESLRGREHATRAGWVMAVWPLAFFLYGAVYSDALFLLCVSSAFLSLERRNLVLATVLGALATAARPVGPAVVLGLVARAVELRVREERKVRPIDLLPLFAAAGLGAYMLFQQRAFGTPTAFIETQAGWNQTPGPRTWFKVNWVTSERFVERLPRSLMHLGLVSLCLAMVPRVWRTLGVGYALYVLAICGLPLVSSIDFIGLGRYALAAFPAMLAFGQWLWERPLRWRVWFPLSVGLLAICVHKFALGRYIS